MTTIVRSITDVLHARVKPQARRFPRNERMRVKCGSLVKGLTAYALSEIHVFSVLVSTRLAPRVWVAFVIEKRVRNLIFSSSGSSSFSKSFGVRHKQSASYGGHRWSRKVCNSCRVDEDAAAHHFGASHVGSDVSAEYHAQSHKI